MFSWDFFIGHIKATTPQLVKMRVGNEGVKYIPLNELLI